MQEKNILPAHSADKKSTFRKWANTIVKDYTIQGWVMDEERLMSSYLDYAEMQAERHIPMTMQDWNEKLKIFAICDCESPLMTALLAI